MQTFKVYPKRISSTGNDERFDFTCERFEIKDEQFILYNSTDKESAEGFISFKDVAAILPDQGENYYHFHGKPLTFLVYLRNRSKPLEISADAFRIEGSCVVFLAQRPDSLGQVEADRPLPGIYIALSEVIAITPSDGLQTWRA